jgi:midasin (ATPase involved in ribosome maturation)
MTFLDGLESFPQVASYSREALQDVRTGALQYLQQLIPLERESTEGLSSLDTSRYVQLGSFAIPRGTRELELHSFNLQVPTTRENAMRVFRAGQLMKPILLEGSPGVGKTTLITALANISGHHLCRINLSDQTDLMDLFGSDLPVEGGSPGEFAWKDAEFLRALQEGHWVLLDEMNLAPQAVLEGLNAVLDHRGTVFIPELGQSFTRHPSFRIFAAQNPLQQGGGRKGLPKSFVNRFTKVYVDELSPSDLLLVIRHLFPAYPAEILQRMIEYNARLNEEVAVRRSFGKEGAPWEFNLRDVIRWATLLDVHGRVLHPAERLWPIYLSRFRTDADRQRASLLFDSVFGRSATDRTLAPHVTVTSTHLRIGSIWMLRKRPGHSYGSPPILQAHATALETVALAVEHNWLAIITGHERTGKKTLVESLAHLMGNTLQSISVNSNTDTSDILGSFEQTDSHSQTSPSQGAHFEWVDGILLHALRQGHWLLMDNANLCNPSVLDRLNSLCEPNGTVVLNERGQVNGEVQVITPHPNFRLFMTVDPRYGELSRAMRNRGMEVALTSALSIEDSSRLVDHLHLPTVLSSVVQHRADTVGTFEYMRRGVKLGHDLHSEEVTADRTPVLLSLSDDTTAGAVTEYASALAKLSDIGFEDDSFFDFAASALPRRLLRLLHRMTATRNVKFGNFLSALHEFGQSGIGRRVQDTYAKSWGVPSSLLLAQVSTDHFQSRSQRVFLFDVLNTFEYISLWTSI